MNSILIVIYAHYVKLIIEGKKTVEVRKNKNLANAIKKLIAEEGGCWVYIYVAKGKLKLTKIPELELANGKVVARFWCDKVEEIIFNGLKYVNQEYITESLKENELFKKSCLNLFELHNYLNGSLSNEKCGYAIHISKLEVFDRPRELYEFQKPITCETCKLNNTNCHCEKCFVEKAPQNYCYIEGEK